MDRCVAVVQPPAVVLVARQLHLAVAHRVVIAVDLADHVDGLPVHAVLALLAPGPALGVDAADLAHRVGADAGPVGGAAGGDPRHLALVPALDVAPLLRAEGVDRLPHLLGRRRGPLRIGLPGPSHAVGEVGAEGAVRAAHRDRMRDVADTERPSGGVHLAEAGDRRRSSRASACRRCRTRASPRRHRARRAGAPCPAGPGSPAVRPAGPAANGRPRSVRRGDAGAPARPGSRAPCASSSWGRGGPARSCRAPASPDRAAPRSRRVRPASGPATRCAGR